MQLGSSKVCLLTDLRCYVITYFQLLFIYCEMRCDEIRYTWIQWTIEFELDSIWKNNEQSFSENFQTAKQYPLNLRFIGSSELLLGLKRRVWFIVSSERLYSDDAFSWKLNHDMVGFEAVYREHSGVVYTAAASKVVEVWKISRCSNILLHDRWVKQPCCQVLRELKNRGLYLTNTILIFQLLNKLTFGLFHLPKNLFNPLHIYLFIFKIQAKIYGTHFLAYQ